MATLSITIDGIEIHIPRGGTILDAAREAGVYIPTLCAHPALPSVEGMKSDAYVFRGEKRIENDGPDADWDGCGVCAVEAD
ncbi:MAG: 2Fe-2S iron-sulfur cluster binding domain-containing protein, partial [Deltaproteobacteria bacterium]|nr:2Fe-2S iron-sulfur cluster binding domain-containing protein [Deltaproteobacteria bacterium]